MSTVAVIGPGYVGLPLVVAYDKLARTIGFDSDGKPRSAGGRGIGADPYDLTHQAEMLGCHPQVITAGRRINDGMGRYIAEQIVKQMIAGGRVRSST